jgi:hypothetical protein
VDASAIGRASIAMHLLGKQRLPRSFYLVCGNALFDGLAAF